MSAKKKRASRFGTFVAAAAGNGTSTQATPLAGAPLPEALDEGSGTLDELTARVFRTTISDPGTYPSSQPSKLWASRDEVQQAVPEATDAPATSDYLPEMQTLFRDAMGQRVPSRIDPDVRPPPTTSSPSPAPTPHPSPPSTAPAQKLPSPRHRHRGDKLTRECLNNLDRIRKELAGLREELKSPPSVAAYLRIKERVGQLDEALKRQNRRVDSVRAEQQVAATDLEVVRSSLAEWKSGIVLTAQDVGYDTGG